MIKKRLLILFLIFLILISILISRFVIKFVYVSPQTSTKTLPYIAKSIWHIEKNFDKIMYLCQKNHKDMKFLYKNYYGSGFLKENTIPNDLDVSAGIDLGTYEYDGKNADEIANDIEDKIFLYHLLSHSVFEEDKENNYLLNKSATDYLFELQTKSKESIENIKNGLNHVMKGEEQVIHLHKKFEGNDVDYTFILNNNEILTNEMTPLFAYATNILYNSKMMDYPREISILPDFYVKIKNTETGEIKNIELIEESFLGERFQISRRFFVPIVFTGNNSLDYVKKLDYLKDDEKYFETRMFNYFRYLNEIEVFLQYSVDPVKLLKRMHQCTDIIEPALNKTEKNKIYGDIRTVMNNKDIQNANEYKNVIKNLEFLCSSSYIFKRAVYIEFIENILNTSNDILAKLYVTEKYEDEIKNLSNFNNEVQAQINSLHSDDKLNILLKFLNDNFINISVELTKIINKNIPNTQEFVKDYEILKNIAINAGYTKIDIYQKDLNTIYILKNDFTKNLSSEKLKLLAKENNMPENIEYKLIDKKSLQKGSRSEFRYVRFNTSKSQDEYYKKLRESILKDKHNFKIKRKYILAF